MEQQNLHVFNSPFYVPKKFLLATSNFQIILVAYDNLIIYS